MKNHYSFWLLISTLTFFNPFNLTVPIHLSTFFAPSEAPMLVGPSVQGMEVTSEVFNGSKLNVSVTTTGITFVNTGLDNTTVNTTNVKIFNNTTNVEFTDTGVNGTGGGDAITITALGLDFSTEYRVEIGSGVLDLEGNPMDPFTYTFTTGTQPGNLPSSIEFQTTMVASGDKYTSLRIGPDGKLYGLVNDGEINRWTIENDGTLSNKETIGSLQTAEGGNRLAIGMDFDPSSTAGNLILWVSHTKFGFSNQPDWEGKITQLSGANLENVQDYVVNLPRSTRDHVTNGIDFGPDGALYFLQGSNTAMGAPDNAWGNRPERLLSAAALRLDVNAVTTPPLDAKTEDGGTYDPFAVGAPLTLFATGVRNPYDLVWHSNNNLYIPTNGSASGGNTPATPGYPNAPTGVPQRIDGSYTGGAVPGLTNVSTQNDYLFRVGLNGGTYHGHPNPTRGEYVLNGGNPTASSDPGQVSEYPGGTLVDPNYAGFAYDFGKSKSPNGVIEYQSNSFGGALKGKLLVVRYSGGNDIIILTPGGANNDVVNAELAIYDEATGNTVSFGDPLDLTENLANGDIYVSEYGSSEITLLRPTVPPVDEPAITASKEELIWSGFTSSVRPNYSVDVEIINEGTQQLTINNITTSGADANMFSVAPNSVNINAGASATITVTFDPSSTGPKEASLDISSNDPDDGTFSIPLYALAASNFEGNNEPPLAQIVQTLGYNIDVGFTTLASNGNSFPIGDEELIDLFEKAGAGVVSITPVARYAPDFDVPFGWYQPDGTNSPSTTTVGTMSGLGNDANPHHQMLFPPLDGGSTDFEPATVSFNPGNLIFGLFAESPQHIGYTEDDINSPTNVGSLHRTRIYPLKDRNGNDIPNSYLVGFEEAHNHDHNDYVFVVSNVKPATSTDGLLVANANSVDFGGVAVNGMQTETVTLSNNGSTAINLSDISLTGDNTFSILTNPLPTEVAPSSSVDIDIQFAPTAEGSQSGILSVTHDGLDSPLDISLSGNGTQPGSAIVRINAGGGAYTDSNNNQWSEDNTSYITGSYETDFKTFDVQNTTDDDLYLTYHYGDNGAPFSYNIPLPNGTYDVNLYFTEVFFSGSNQRVFDVVLEGNLVIDDLDLVATVGSETAYIESFSNVAVDDGTLNIDFSSTVNNAIISAIEIIGQGSGGNTPPVVDIISPADNSSFEEGTSVSFTATATDTEEGNIDDEISWSSNIDGSIGSTGTFSTSALSVGTHIITASATDQGSLTGSDQITVQITAPAGNVLYREVFWNENPNDNISIIDRGWNAYETGGNVVPTDKQAASNGFGNATGLQNINAGDTDPTPEDDRGLAAAFNNKNTYFFFTNEYSIDLSTTTITEFNWFQGHSANATTRIAIQMNGQWYVSTATFTGPNIGSASNFPAQATEQTLPFSTAAASWQELNFTAGSTLSLGNTLSSDLPNGTITGFGMYGQNGGGFTMRFDTYQIEGMSTNVNTPPTVTITSPADNSSFEEGSAVSFSATANDTEEGDLAGNLMWNSDLDGSIGSGASFSTNGLSVGTHTITASVTDQGSLTGSDQITVTVTAPTTNAVVRLNVAGNAYTDTNGDEWIADNTSWLSGSSNTSNSSNGIGDILGTDDDEIYLHRRFGENFTYDIPVDNGTYTVKLHFAEIHWGVKGDGLTPDDGDPAGERLFDVSIEDVLKLDDLDLYAEVGGKTALIETFPGVVVNDGSMKIDFVVTPDKDFAIVQGIEILSEATSNTPPIVTITNPADNSSFEEGSAVSFSATANDTEEGDLAGNLMWNSDLDGSIGSGASFSTNGLSVGTHTITASVTDQGSLTGSDQITVEITAPPMPTTTRINVGGNAYTDLNGDDWSADDSGLITGSTSTSMSTNDIGDIMGTDDDAIYYARRWGENFTYDIPVTNGTYTVRLHFAEIHWGVKGSGLVNDPTNQRLFDVSIEGSLLTDNLDLYAEVGGATALVEEYPAVMVNDGVMTIQFVVEPDKDNAIVQGIEILPASSTTNSLNGSLTLEGRSDHSSDITVEMYTAGTANMQHSAVVPTDANGNFTMENIPTGTFDIYCKSDGYLRKKAANVTISAGTNAFNVGQLLAGDANNDNVVSSLDFSILATTFNLADGMQGYDGRADFNGSQTVSAEDFSLLAGNFNVAGDNPDTNEN